MDTAERIRHLHNLAERAYYEFEARNLEMVDARLDRIAFWTEEIRRELAGQMAGAQS